MYPAGELAVLRQLLLNICLHPQSTYPIMLNLDMTCLCKPDLLASEDVIWSGSALFDINYVNLYQKPGSSNLIGWKLEKGVAA